MAALPLILDDLTCFGADLGRGNLLGVQVAMQPEDYASPEALHARLDAYLDVAASQGWLRPDSIVIFPEYIGAWLVAADQQQTVYQAQTIDAGLRSMVLAQPGKFIRALPRARGRDKIRDAVFRMRAGRAASAYQQVFSLLARARQVTVVAGSIVLPEPQVIDGQLSPGDGPLQNCAFVFHPDGSLDAQVTRKVFPIRSEQPFLSAAAVGQLPVYQTPAGRLGVLVCADSWYPQTYAALAGRGVQLLAVPAYLSPDGIWEQPWAGYSGQPAPPDVDLADIGRIREGQAWLKYSLAGRMPACGAVTGMQVFLRGRIWDLGSDGHTIAVTQTGVFEAPHVHGAALVNCWLA